MELRIDEILGQGMAAKWKKAKLDDYWAELVAQTNDDFEEAKSAFICKYCNDHTYEGSLIRHLQSNKVRKPMSSSFLDHQERIDKIITFTEVPKGARDYLSKE